MPMNMGRMPVRQGRQAKRGFTLTEIAIVLGIIGLILGAIWVAAAAVYNNLRVSKATTQLLTVTQAVRAMYATSNVVDNQADMTINAAQAAKALTYIQAGIFPNDTLNAANTEAFDPWQGTITVQSQSFTAGNNDAFSVVFDSVPLSACISMVTANSGQGKDASLVGVSIGAANAVPLAAGAATTGATFPAAAFPVTASSAQTKCVAAGNAIAFSFRLKG